MLTVVIQLLVFARTESRSGSGNKLSNVRSFIILRSGEGLIFFDINKFITFCGSNAHAAFRSV